jgi:signal transduction histidine kinase
VASARQLIRPESVTPATHARGSVYLRLLIVGGSERAAAQIRQQLLAVASEIVVEHRVSWAAAETAALSGAYGCLVVECGRGKSDEVELVADIRASGCDAPLIAVSQSGTAQMAVRALELGAQDYLSRATMSGSALLRAIENAVEKVTLQCELTTQRRDLERYVSVVAHDLQQPLCAVLNNMELLQDTYTAGLAPQAQDCVNSAVRMSKRMSAMIEGLLEHAKAGPHGSTPVPVSLDLVTDAAINHQQVRLKESNAQVHRGPLPEVMATEVSLLQLMQNLVGNAIKFRVAGRVPVVHIGATRQDHLWRVSVTDNGIGIPSGQFDSVFDPFRRLHSEEDYPGAGIGLSTCRRIVEGFGGKIWIESTLGQGSTFSYTVPATD